MSQLSWRTKVTSACILHNPSVDWKHHLVLWTVRLHLIKATLQSAS